MLSYDKPVYTRFASGGIERHTIATSVAEAVQELFLHAGVDSLEGEGGLVPYDRLVLLELLRVSQGSWQPVLAYED